VELASTREELRRAPHDKSASESFFRERSPLPVDVVELQTRIRSIKTRMQEAIATNGFSKARLCSEEDWKERDKLYVLYRRYGLTGWILD